MFQNFDERADPGQGAGRIERLRSLLADLGLDGFVVPRADEHQGEYIPPAAARLAWLTGFTGSAGEALVLGDRAFIFVDGRYTLQVRDQVDTSVFEPLSSLATPLPGFLAAHAKGLRIGIDPWLHTLADSRTLSKTLEAAGGALVTLPANPIDRLWNDRPAPPKGLVVPHPDHHAGRTAAEKIADLRAALASDKADAVVLTDPSSVAWTFNVRGSDVAHTPLPLCFAILGRETPPQLFIDADKLGDEARRHLEGLADLHDPAGFEPALRRLGGTVMLDPALAAARIAALVEEAGGTILERPDPARLPRAIKNEAEIAGARAAHRRDGAAVAAFLHWIEEAPVGSVSEIMAAERLEAFRAEYGRREGMELRDIAFDTIVGSGPNGAIVHYRVNRDTDRLLAEGELFLVDSGAQYLDGTTDITRTVPIGEPTQGMREKFTLVLKGMIAISAARFPKGTRGVDLDPLARIALWKAGCDYAHGTGHGVGSYLAVHEGPQSISRRGMAVLEPGMILSNEPGYYREGAFGIRIENLILIRQAEPVAGGDIAMHAFETLTLAPIDRRLIVTELLDAQELRWLDAYHRHVRDALTPLLGATVADWLAQATAPLDQAMRF